MQGQRERMLLVLLIAAFSPRVSAETKKMDLVPNAVDDQYLTCREDMLHKVVEGGLLQAELDASEELRAAWRPQRCPHPQTLPGGTPAHSQALLAYAHGGTAFRRLFNAAVETQGGNQTIYADHFPFKALHFLLTDTLRLLSEDGACRTVFRGSATQYQAEVGSRVRFGRFTGATARRTDSTEAAAGEEEGGTLFNITSCWAATVEPYACEADLAGVLLSPAEEFRVEEVKTHPDEYTEIVLTSARMHSNDECYLVSRVPAPAPTPKGSSPPLLGNSVFLLAVSLSVSLATKTGHL